MNNSAEKPETASSQKVAVVGGGLAGLAAAQRLAMRGAQVTLFEAKRELGGRAGSFRDELVGDVVDHCQHVAMGCCRDYLQFCETAGCSQMFDRHDVIPFIGPAGRQYDLKAAAWLPSPLHLAPSLLRLGYLSMWERIQVARAMLKLARTGLADEGASIGQWLAGQGQSTNAIKRFWSIVLVSALGESLDRASVAAAKKVFVDGFMNTRDGYNLLIPTKPLKAIYDQIEHHLGRHGVMIRKSTPISRITITERSGEMRATSVELSDGCSVPVDTVVVAVDWRSLERLFERPPSPLLETVRWTQTLEAAPITSVHLWFDQAIFKHISHAVLIDRLSQWVFRRERTRQDRERGQHYYQVVISASRNLDERCRDDVVEEVRSELASVWPLAKTANLIRSRMLTQKNAVFSYRPGLDRSRPAQSTAIGNLVLAGDWTATSWPATMEGAVRSGFMAAELLT
jgi:squalene-associated FAD-dependent desaturase